MYLTARYSTYCSRQRVSIQHAVRNYLGQVTAREESQMTEFAKLFKRCSNLNQLESVYAFMIKNNETHDCFLVNQFISACTSLCCPNLAVAAFHELNDPNGYVYTAVIRALHRCFQPMKALHMYKDMLKTHIRPTSFTFSSVIKSCTFTSGLNSGEGIHGQIWKCGYASHLHVQTALIDFYSNLGRIGEARRVFDGLYERDGFAWTTMVSSYVRCGDLSSARKLFHEMPSTGTASWNTMIHGFANIGDVESAKDFFDKMPQKDIISWTTMINCYSQNKHYKKALEVFNEMKKIGIKPDEITMSTIISACAHLGWLNLGKDVHIYLMHAQFDLDIYIGSALIDMYAKCGDIERSLVVFLKLREKNLFCWNSLIEGFSVHGLAKEALAIFHMMKKEKIEPNSITFISILSACAHAGLVEEGRSMFYQMTHDFNILPEIKHYGCMVDLLCKAGLLQESLELIRSMSMEPSSVIWVSLLGGCKLQKNLEIAQLAVDKLTVLEPNNSGHHNLLLNMYAEANRWGEVARIRAKMKSLGVEKSCPGSSWVEVNKRIFQFAASDSCLSASKEIFCLLDLLAGELKLIYRPEFHAVS